MNSEDMAIRLILKAGIEKEDLIKALEEAISEANPQMDVDVRKEVGPISDGESTEEVVRRIIPILEKITTASQEMSQAQIEALKRFEAAQEAQRNHDRRQTTISNKDILSETTGGDDEEEGPGRSDRALSTINRNVGRATGAIADGLKFMMTSGFELVEGIHNQMKQASPLLQAVESMFNLAVQLFFMPLGNKLAEVMIPATVDLLDKVTDMWDAFEGKSLGEMVTISIAEGTKMFGQYLKDIGGILAEEESIVGTMGGILLKIGVFMETKGETMLDAVVRLTDWTLSNLPSFIKWYMAMKGAEAGANMFSSIPIFGSILGAAVGGSIGYGATDRVFDSLGIQGFAEGGWVPATPGGRLAVVGEVEDEYIIPKSKMGIMGSTQIINNFYGYNEQELMEKVNDTVNTAVSRSRISGAF